jgi:hypothetical protein
VKPKRAVQARLPNTGRAVPSLTVESFAMPGYAHKPKHRNVSSSRDQQRPAR